MPKAIILLFHPDLKRSKANAALAAAAAGLADFEIVDMGALYPTGAIDVDMEVRRLLSADRIVLQFPVQWYSTPPLLRTWQDSVLTRMYYIAYENEGRKLEGTPVLIAATAGNGPDAYKPSGINLFPLDELLRPLHATANRCGLPWSQPFIVYEANKLPQEALQKAADRYVERLRHWVGETAAGPFDCVMS